MGPLHVAGPSFILLHSPDTLIGLSSERLQMIFDLAKGLEQVLQDLFFLWISAHHHRIRAWMFIPVNKHLMYIWRFPEIAGSQIIYVYRIFAQKPSSYGGTPHDHGTPHRIHLNSWASHDIGVAVVPDARLEKGQRQVPEHHSRIANWNICCKLKSVM